MKNKLGYLFVILFWIISFSAFSQSQQTGADLKLVGKESKVKDFV